MPFSSENWNRPAQEVGVNGYFVWALDSEVKSLHRHNVRLRIIRRYQPIQLTTKNVFANQKRLPPIIRV